MDTKTEKDKVPGGSATEQSRATGTTGQLTRARVAVSATFAMVGGGQNAPPPL